MDRSERTPNKVTLDCQQVHSKPYDSQIECLKEIISGLKAEIERHDRECNLTKRQQEMERLRKKEDELWNTTKELGELKQFLSTVKSEIDSMHKIMPAQEQAALVGKENTRLSNNSETGIGDKQSEIMELRQSVASLQARMDRARDEAAKFQTENEQLKDELEKAKADNLSLEAKLKDEGRQLNSQLADLITKVNKNSEVLNLFYDHCRSDGNQVKLLHGRLEALHAELQEIETRVDVCAGELRLVSVHLLPNFPNYSISQSDEGPEGRVAKKVRCLIEQALLKLPRFEPQLAAKKPIEPNKADIETSNYTNSMHIPPLRRAGTLGSDTEETLYNSEHSPVVSPERHSTDGPVDERKAPDVDETSLQLETFRLTVLLHPLSAISSTGDEASLTLKSLLKVKTVYSPELVEGSDLASIDSVIKAARNTKAPLSKALKRMEFQGKQVFSEPWLETYVTIFHLFINLKRAVNTEKRGAKKLLEPTEQTNQQQDPAAAGAERSRRVKTK